MTEAEIETELRLLSSQVKQLIEQGQSRETEWRRLGLVAKTASVALSLVGLGFILAPLVFQATGPGSGFHDQTTMMGFMFMVSSTPLLLLGQALHRRRST